MLTMELRRTVRSADSGPRELGAWDLRRDRVAADRLAGLLADRADADMSESHVRQSRSVVAVWQELESRMRGQ